MGKKLLVAAIFTVITSIFSLDMAFASTINNPDTIKVGLDSIKSSSLTLKLEGDFKVNGAQMSNKSLTFKVSSSKISFNGSTYSEISIEPLSSSSKVTTVSSGKTNVYSGSLVLKVSSGSILPINYVEMQEYLKGVLPYEISDSYPIEAIKTQAITSRTFALSNLHKHKASGYEVCDTTNCQVYRGENSSYKNIEKAVDETENQILTYNDSLASVTFGASNGGYTESSQNIWGSLSEYLPAREDKYDVNPWPSNVVYTKSQVSSKLKSAGHLSSSDTFVKIGNITRNSSGRVADMEIVYKNSKGIQTTKILKKEEPRWAFSLRSMKFNVSLSGDKYTFSGSGYGHGVGMSQYGAKARAEAGQGSQEILGFYFPNTDLEVVDNEGKTSPLTSTSSEKTGSRGGILKNMQGKLNLPK